ncbi:MAG TPA: phosphopentomutase [Fimbriimonadaceae bacterium]|nr:phosphopentomutase [Fimbriimonadaceae bacterium]
MKRAILIVLDGCGAGEAPDSPAFGDNDHPATVRHVWEKAGGLKTPNLAACGFLSACGIEAGGTPKARWGRLRELSMGKDSVTGHWEMMGVITEKPFPTYPNGFPIPLVKEFERRIGVQTLGNRPASGTQIIQELGPLHVETGFPILYTSADSVFQLACHEAVVPLEKLYEWCRIAREVCVAPNNVQRVIARPFVGDEPSGFTRTQHRKDFPLPAPPNLADEIGDVYGIGVVPELFDGRGFRQVRRTQNNAEHEGAVQAALESDARFIFANFEDFDMLYGHRNDPAGFARALEQFDVYLGGLLTKLGPEDLLLLSADHGNDPTSASTDHSREYVPACVVGASVSPGPLGDVDGMSAIGATVAAHLGIPWDRGKSLL